MEDSPRTTGRWDRPTQVTTVLTSFAEELRRLSGNPATSADMAAEGMPTLVGLLFAGPKAAEEAAVALRCLAISTPSLKDFMRERGVIPALIQVMDLRRQGGSGMGRAAAEAAGALFVLTHGNTPNQNAVREGGGLMLLVALVADGGSVAARFAAAALANAVCDNAANRRFVREEAAGIVPLVALLRSAAGSTASEHAARALLNLSYDVANQEAIGAGGGVEALVQQLPFGGRPALLSGWALIELMHGHDENERRLRRAGGSERIWNELLSTTRRLAQELPALAESKIFDRGVSLAWDAPVPSSASGAVARGGDTVMR